MAWKIRHDSGNNLSGSTSAGVVKLALVTVLAHQVKLWKHLAKQMVNCNRPSLDAVTTEVLVLAGVLCLFHAACPTANSPWLNVCSRDIRSNGLKDKSVSLCDAMKNPLCSKGSCNFQGVQVAGHSFTAAEVAMNF